MCSRITCYTIIHSRIFAKKMPPVGIEPATSTHVAQTLTKLTKWPGGNPRGLTSTNGTDVRNIHRENAPPDLRPQNRTVARQAGPRQMKRLRKTKNGKKDILRISAYFIVSFFISVCRGPAGAGRRSVLRARKHGAIFSWPGCYFCKLRKGLRYRG